MQKTTYLWLLSLLIAANSTQAQKMDIMDYFKAFMSNSKSPHNQMFEMNAKLSNSNGEYLIYYFEGDDRPIKLDVKPNFITFKKDYFEGWQGNECYPTFKLYTKADGSQILGVTEDGFTHHGYRSKYKPARMSLRERKQQGKEACPQYQWQQLPKPIKFWTYKAGTWTEVTDQVMTEFFSFEQMIIKTTAKAQPDVAAYLAEEITFFDGMYPLYRLEPNSNDITVWVDEARLKTFTTESDIPSNHDNITAKTATATAKLFDFIEQTTFKTYTLTWDAKAGKFIKKP